MARAHRQHTAQEGLAERAAVPSPSEGEVPCVQCRWPIRPDAEGDVRCGRCGVAQYVNERGGQGRWPDGLEPESLRTSSADYRPDPDAPLVDGGAQNGAQPAGE